MVVVVSQGKANDWLVEKGFLCILCLDVGLGLSCDSLNVKQSLLSGLLLSELLPSSDTAGLAARLASVLAGMMAVRRMEGRDGRQLMRQLEEELVQLIYKRLNSMLLKVLMRKIDVLQFMIILV